mmetsp:Transcript_4942/g.11094  ORF Transcript_4942/g.11094 Transcript_4942/m.11094 type:complete len:102 (+) Transcript_4942:218-523(+)
MREVEKAKIFAKFRAHAPADLCPPICFHKVFQAPSLVTVVDILSWLKVARVCLGFGVSVAMQGPISQWVSDPCTKFGGLSTTQMVWSITCLPLTLFDYNLL